MGFALPRLHAFPRLHVITDTRATVAGNDPLTVVRAAVAAATARGVTADLAVQVRVEDAVTDREAYELTAKVLEVCRAVGVLCLVNDRLHVALAAGAGGAHVGADDLPVSAARRVLNLSAAEGLSTPEGRGEPEGRDAPEGRGALEGIGASEGRGVASGRGVAEQRLVLGATCRYPDAARRAVADGASYLGVGPAFATSTKGGLPEPIGPAGIGAVAAAVPGTPVIAIGGVTVASVAALLAAGAHGVAVVGALSSAEDPHAVTADLLTAVKG